MKAVGGRGCEGKRAKEGYERYMEKGETKGIADVLNLAEERRGKGRCADC